MKTIFKKFIFIYLILNAMIYAVFPVLASLLYGTTDDYIFKDWPIFLVQKFILMSTVINISISAAVYMTRDIAKESND